MKNELDVSMSSRPSSPTLVVAHLLIRIAEILPYNDKEVLLKAIRLALYFSPFLTHTLTGRIVLHLLVSPIGTWLLDGVQLILEKISVQLAIAVRK